ncbi:cytochrome P450 2K1-like [Lissotriton helveticus]
MTVLNLLLQSMSTSSLLCLVTCIVLLFYFWAGSKKSVLRMPPGPAPLPFIGNLNLVDLKNMHKSLMELSEKHGNVFTVHFGPKKMVILTGYETIKDALVNQADDFGERAEVPIFQRISGGHGIVFSHGEPWKVMRRFTLSTLRDFGMGKKTIEDKILDELQALITHFESYKGNPFDTRIILNSAVSNVICSIIFGKRFEYEDPTFLTLIHLLSENIRLIGTSQVQLYNFCPSLGFLFGAHKTVGKNADDQIAFFKGFFKEHKTEFDANNITGFIDAYLLRQEQESKNSSTHFHDKNLEHCTLDLFGGGTETTSTTLRWALLLMMKYPEIQRKVQEEITCAIKPGQVPRVEDRKNMPYTDAVVHEIQRFADILPLNLSRVTTTDVNFRGYCIPKGTEVMPLLISVLQDKTQWATPYEFNPQHFLDASGRFVKKDAFMPFSIGRRACVGESLAKMELFLFFAGLLQKFTFRPPPGVTEAELDLTEEVSLTLSPKPHRVCAVPREPIV